MAAVGHLDDRGRIICGNGAVAGTAGKWNPAVRGASREFKGRVFQGIALYPLYQEGHPIDRDIRFGGGGERNGEGKGGKIRIAQLPEDICLIQPGIHHNPLQPEGIRIRRKFLQHSGFLIQSDCQPIFLKDQVPTFMGKIAAAALACAAAKQQGNG